jgi:hypothetical protein
VTWRPKAGIVEPEGTYIARQGLGKHTPTETNTQATIEEPVSKQRILLETVFSVRSVQSGYEEELVEFRGVSLPGYELGSRGIGRIMARRLNV